MQLSGCKVSREGRIVLKIRANALVAPQAEGFIRAYMEIAA